jgi:hypothetical protein
MPTYVYKHPNEERYIEVIQSMNDEHTHFDEDDVEWKRVFVNPQLNVESNIDPFSNVDFIEKTGKMKGSYGDVMDLSKELSEKRKEANGGIDPVKKSYYEKYSKERKGAKHPQQTKDEGYESKNVKITYD